MNTDTLSRPPALLAAIHRWLFDPDFDGGFQRVFDRAIGLLVFASVAAVLLESSPAIHASHAAAFRAFDLFVVAVFGVEYLLRLLTAPLLPEFAGSRHPRLRYAFSVHALADLLAIVPFCAVLFMAADLGALRLLWLMRVLRMAKLSRLLLPAWQEFREMNEGRSVREKVFALLEPTGHSGRLHLYADNFIVFWIVLSILCVVLESVDSVERLFAAQFRWIDMIAFTIFSIEYAARVYAAPDNPLFANTRLPRWAHLRSWPAVIDLLTILPFLLEHFLAHQLDLRFLRVFRLARMLKLTRYTSATTTLMKVMRREWQIIGAAVFMILLLVVLTASLGYLFEHDAQPDKFENIPQSIYWAVVTLASVGYGDISPVTPMGRLLTVVLALVGIGLFAIPAGLLASAFTDQLHLDRESFRLRLQQALADGVVDPGEEQEIVAEAERLHLSETEFERLIDEARKAFRQTLEAQEMSFGHLMLDANVHPEFAAEQFRILVAQLRLLQRATGEEQLAALLAAGERRDDDALRVARALAQPAASPRSRPASKADDGPQLF